MSEKKTKNISKPFQCKCGKGFGTTYSLQRHQSKSCQIESTYFLSIFKSRPQHFNLISFISDLHSSSDDDVIGDGENNRMKTLSTITEPPSKIRKSSRSSNELESCPSSFESNARKRKQHPKKIIQERSAAIVQKPRKKVHANSHQHDYAGSNVAGDTSELCELFVSFERRMLKFCFTVSAWSAQSSKHTMQRQLNAYSTDRIIHPILSAKATVADISESGCSVYQTKPKSMCFTQISEKQIDDDESDSDTGN